MSKAALHARAKRRDELVPESGIIAERHHGVHEKCDAEIDRLTRELARSEEQNARLHVQWGAFFKREMAEAVRIIREARVFLEPTGDDDDPALEVIGAMDTFLAATADEPAHLRTRAAE